MGVVLEVAMDSLKVHEGGLVTLPARRTVTVRLAIYSLTNEMTSTDRGTEAR